MDRAHDLIDHFITAFLLSVLKRDPAAAEALAPENVTFPGIYYETTSRKYPHLQEVPPPPGSTPTSRKYPHLQDKGVALPAYLHIHGPIRQGRPVQRRRLS